MADEFSPIEPPCDVCGRNPSAPGYSFCSGCIRGLNAEFMADDVEFDDMTYPLLREFGPDVQRSYIWRDFTRQEIEAFARELK